MHSKPMLVLGFIKNAKKGKRAILFATFAVNENHWFTIHPVNFTHLRYTQLAFQ
jgi:hypothetical protein